MIIVPLLLILGDLGVSCYMENKIKILQKTLYYANTVMYNSAQKYKAESCYEYGQHDNTKTEFTV